jgi:glycogen debranching enzyme
MMSSQRQMDSFGGQPGGALVPPPLAEWIEADGLGGYAMGTVCGTASRRYHALFQPALHPPTGRMSLVQGIRIVDTGGVVVWPLNAEAPAGSYGFEADPWPTWTVKLPDGGWLGLELVTLHDVGWVIVRLRDRSGPGQGVGPIRLELDLTGRDYHGPLLEVPTEWSLDGDANNGVLVPSEASIGLVPSVRVMTTGILEAVGRPAPEVIYGEETRRGLEDQEVAWTAAVVNLAWDSNRVGPTSEHYVLLGLAGKEPPGLMTGDLAPWCVGALNQERSRRGELRDQAPEWMKSLHWNGPELMRRADQFMVRRGNGHSILAGYPWFTDWGRDTFIAMRGLMMATDRWSLAVEILKEWAGTVSRGMLPNFFPDAGTEPEYNSVDASLWYCVCAGELMDAADRGSVVLADSDRHKIHGAVDAILAGYESGTRFGIGMDPTDGLLRAGAAGWQLTWMDARSDGREVTPRIGKPVEIQALWYNALMVGGKWNPDRMSLALKVRQSFADKFADKDTGGLVDVVDVDHIPGKLNRDVRPNQVLAVGGLPHALVDGELAEGVVALVWRELWTPIGLRSLSPTNPDYCPKYDGGRISRDAKYHQGTAWGWLLGPFMEAWLRTHPGMEGWATVEQDFLRPMEVHLKTQGLGHLTEVADGDWPHQAGGCPAQAWSLGEYLRIRRLLHELRNGAVFSQ